MKRNRLSRIENDGPGVLDISSLVDICFLLLIYFIVTTTIMPQERDLPVGVPDRGGSGFVGDSFQINIDASGRISCGEAMDRTPLDADPSVRDLPLLSARLEFFQQGVRAAGEECLVVINADGEATSQRVVDVLNTLAGLQIDKVTFTDWQEEE